MEALLTQVFKTIVESHKEGIRFESVLEEVENLTLSKHYPVAIMPHIVRTIDIINGVPYAKYEITLIFLCSFEHSRIGQEPHVQATHVANTYASDVYVQFYNNYGKKAATFNDDAINFRTSSATTNIITAIGDLTLTGCDMSFTVTDQTPISCSTNGSNFN